MKRNKISIRLTDNQLLVLDELREKLNCSYSVMIRAIVLDFLTRNEDCIERIVTGERVIDFQEIINNEEEENED